MTDYYPLLARAIAGRSEAERQAIFVRAREALERQLRGFEPPLAEEDIRKELGALEDVIARIIGEQAPSIPPATAQTEPVAAPASLDAADAVPDQSSPGPVAIEEGPASAPVIRPRMPMRSDKKGPARKLALFGGAALALMVAIGVVALSRKDDPNRFAAQRTPPVVAAPSGAAGDEVKTEGRLGSAEPARTPPSAAASPPADSRAPQPEPPARPNQPAANIPVTNFGRAFMVLEAPGGGAPNQFEGKADWSFGPDPALRGQRSLRARIDFSAAGLGVELAIAPNADPALGASHTLMVIFEPVAGADPVREMSAIEWRESENQIGTTFASSIVPIADNAFLFGLDRAEAALARNLGLLRSQRWMVFEFRLANGRRGAILAEKGASGEKSVASALAEWK